MNLRCNLRVPITGYLIIRLPTSGEFVDSLKPRFSSTTPPNLPPGVVGPEPWVAGVLLVVDADTILRILLGVAGPVT